MKTVEERQAGLASWGKVETSKNLAAVKFSSRSRGLARSTTKPLFIHCQEDFAVGDTNRDTFPNAAMGNMRGCGRAGGLAAWRRGGSRGSREETRRGRRALPCLPRLPAASFVHIRPPLATNPPGEGGGQRAGKAAGGRTGALKGRRRPVRRASRRGEGDHVARPDERVASTDFF